MTPEDAHAPWVAYESMAEEYAAELVQDRWTKGGEDFEVSFWRRPLTDMFDAIARAGLGVDQLTEPQPLDECRERFPDAWDHLRSEPHFLFFRLTSRGD